MSSPSVSADDCNGSDPIFCTPQPIKSSSEPLMTNEIETEHKTEGITRSHTTSPSRPGTPSCEAMLDLKPQSWVYDVGQEQVIIPYTMAVESQGSPILSAAMTEQWDLAQGFPFPCPVVRDPSRDGEIYVPGEILRQSLPNSRSNSPTRTLSQQSMEPSSNDHSQMSYEDHHIDKKQRSNDNEKTISLSEVVQQVPLRLSQYFDHPPAIHRPRMAQGPLLPPSENLLKKQFAMMDRSMRSKFIGLKNSSLRVREKVCQKRKTSYKEVAEELVSEIGLGEASDRKSLGEAENLKRRVYDVLNVFEAVGLIVKDHKNVYWKGCTAPQPKKLHALESQMDKLKKRLQKRRLYLQQLVENYNAMVALAERNRRSLTTEKQDQKLFLPFFLVHTPDYVSVGVTITKDSKSVQLDFQNADFQVHGDMWVLRQLGFHDQQTPLTQKLASNDFPGTQEDVPIPNEHCPGLNIPLQDSNTKQDGNICYPFSPLPTPVALGESENANSARKSF
eukprot:g1027.t1